MALACGNRLASSLLQDSFGSLASRGDGRRLSSSSSSSPAQLGGFRRSGRAAGLAVVCGPGGYVVAALCFLFAVTLVLVEFLIFWWW